MWIAIIIFVIATLVFLFGVIPIFALDITGLTSLFIYGLDSLFEYSGLVCYFLPMQTVQVCLGIIVSYYIVEWTYFIVLYVIKIFK